MWRRAKHVNALAGKIRREDLDFAAGCVVAELDQVGAVARVETALAGVDAAETRGVARGERDGLRETQAGEAHHVLDRPVHAERRTRQARAAAQAHAMIRS